MNTSKIHLRVKQFSLKTNWSLGERLLHNEGYKKYPHGREPSGQDLCLWGGDSEEKRDFMGRDPLQGVNGSSHKLGTPALGSYTGKTSPPWLVGGPVGLTEGL